MIPRRGVYIKHVAGREVVADVNCAVFFNRGVPYETSHPYGTSDSGAFFLVSESLQRQLLAAFDPEAAEHEIVRFRHDCTPTSTGVFVMQHRLIQAASTGADFDPLAFEETVVSLYADCLRAAYAQAPPSHRPARADTEAAHRHLANATAELLASRYHERWTIARLGRMVHTSPYHLARIFKERFGVPIHRYLDHVRLREALEALANGADDLTQLALALGYCSHSHFTNRFTREFGAPPSAMRAQLTRSRARRLGRRLNN